MKVMDRLTRGQKKEFDRLRSQQKKPPNLNSSQEELTQKDWEELMGIHRLIYKRVHGKIKRR